MDAISFVLGIKSSHLRSAHLRELVYRGRVLQTSPVDGEADTNGGNGHVNGNTNGDISNTPDMGDPRSAYVTAVYEDDAGEEQKWKRTITNQGASEYRLNERVVTAQQYNESLEAENILIKARNFLGFQGDVEAIAIQKPADLTRLIEQVSGSLEHKTEYDRLQKESDQASDQQTFQLNRRRGINSEMRQYQEQKREADNYNKKAEERDAAIVAHVLWKLYHLQRQIEESSAEIQRHQNDMKESRRGIEKFERNFDVAKKEYAQVGREVGKAEKSIKLKEREIEEHFDSLVPIEEKIQVSNKQLTKFANRINTVAKERDTQQASVKQLEKDLHVVEKAQAQWQAEWDKTSNKAGGQLSNQALQQYNKLKEEVSKQSSADQSRIDDLKRRRAGLEGTASSLKSNVESAEWKLQAAEKQYADFTNRQNALQDIVNQTRTQIDQKKQELNALKSKRLQAARTKTELEEKLQEVLRKLIDADDGRKQSEKEARMKDTVSALKRIYPGVRGRVNELCKPKQKKYAEAVSTVLGRHFDAIVVDTEATAKECIEHLRSQRAGQATFIPLNTIQTKAIDSKLRGMHQGMRPAIEAVDFETPVQRAIAYACGNAIVCDNLKIAKYLCYERHVDAKAVTLDGTVIHKGGLMTGGRGREHESRRWEDAEVEKYRKLKDKLLVDIAALPAERSRVIDEETLHGELKGLEAQHGYASEELAGLTRNVTSKKKEVDHHQVQVNEAHPKFAGEQVKLESLDEDLGKLRERVQKVEDNIFGNFCQQNGFTDIREYEARQGSLQQGAARKKLEFTTQKSKLQNQLGFEKIRLQQTEDRIRSLQEQDQRDRCIIDELAEQRDGIRSDLDTLNAELEELVEKLDEQKVLYQKASERLEDQRREVASRSKKMDGVLKTINSLEGEMQRHSSSRYTILRRCKIEDIGLPLAEGSANLDALPINDVSQEGDAMDVDEDELNSSTFGSHAVTDHGIEPDFDELADDLRDDSGDAMDKELQSNIDAITATLENLTPNMHAADRLAAVESRIQDTQKEFEDSQKLHKATKKAFEEVRQKREDLFNKAFNHISEQIEPIYADLTKSAEYTAGGRAYLTADTDEPYLSGVNYHTMPPAKRFRDMEHLSGGEKTMAALALLFAIHSYQPSPFFVLDEVDAALDNANVAKLVNYVKEHAVSYLSWCSEIPTGSSVRAQAKAFSNRVPACNSSSSA